MLGGGEGQPQRQGRMFEAAGINAYTWISGQQLYQDLKARTIVAGKGITADREALENDTRKC